MSESGHDEQNDAATRDAGAASDTGKQGGADQGQHRRRLRRVIVGAVAAGLLGVAGVAFAGWFFACPCGFTPGGYLLGDEVEEPVNNWSFANGVSLCQIQVRTGSLPHAVNLNCMATRSGELYLSCSVCQGKRWSSVVMENENARIRIGEQIYPVRVSRVTESDEKDRAWQARLRKLENYDVPGSGTPVGTERPPDEEWWTFRVISATGAG